MRTPTSYTTAAGEMRWKVRYRRGSTPKAPQTSQTFDGQPEALKFCIDLDAYGWSRAEELLYARLDVASSSTLTLDEWVESYIQTRSKATEGTKAKYRSNWARYFGKQIGRLPLDQVGPDDVARVMIDMSIRQGLMDKTVANHHGLLAGAMKTAHRRGLIPIDPCAESALPQNTGHMSKEAVFLTEDEYERLRESFDARFWPLLDTFAGTGIRWGEAQSLQVRDVNVQAKTLRVTKAIKWHPHAAGRKVGPPKTKLSTRTITLPDPVVVVLARHMKDKDGRDLLFTMPQGGALWHRTFWSRYWVPACNAAGLTDPRPGPHSLRHSHASWLIARGVNLTVIQRRLGHSSIKITSDLYGHLLPDIQVAAAKAAGEVFQGRRRLEIEPPAESA